MAPQFPMTSWGGRSVTFLPYDLYRSPPSVCAAALVFAFSEGRVAVADIRGRGWCVPSGRLEPGETPAEAARRETLEEAGLTLGALVPLGDMVNPAASANAVLAAGYLAEVAHIGLIPASSESRGIRMVTQDELPQMYFLWDALTESIFRYAWERHIALALGSAGKTTRPPLPAPPSLSPSNGAV